MIFCRDLFDVLIVFIEFHILSNGIVYWLPISFLRAWNLISFEASLKGLNLFVWGKSRESEKIRVIFFQKRLSSVCNIQRPSIGFS